MAEPFTPDHVEFFATVILERHRFTEQEVKNWMTRLVEIVDMQVLMPSKAVRCDDFGNEGTSGIVMLTTSHSSIHIWDECPVPYAKLVLYSCKPFLVHPILGMIAQLGARACAWEIRDRNHASEEDVLNGRLYWLLAEGKEDFRKAA